MAQNFELVKHNFCGYFNPDNCSVERFRPWIQFLNEHSIVSSAITSNAPLKIDLLRQICTTATVSEDSKSFTFNVENTQYVVNESVVNQALNLPNDNFVGLPTDNEIINFFQSINYQGEMDITSLSKAYLVAEWDSFFDTLAKVFANCVKTSFFNIPSLLQYIALAIVYNQRINIGQLLISTISKRITAAKRNFARGRKVQCFYPRFLSLIANHLLSTEHQELFNNSNFELAMTTHKKFFTRLDTSSSYTNIPVVVTSFMANFIPLPIIPAAVPEQQPPVVQTTQTETSTATPIQVILPST